MGLPQGAYYGTIVVDRETGKTVEVLKSLEKEDIAEWLRQYPDIRTITRDWDDCYIQAVMEALPHAIQIADRFHLIVNNSDHLWDLSNNFKSTVTERSIKKFHEWIQQVGQSDFREFRNFACGLQNDNVGVIVLLRRS